MFALLFSVVDRTPSSRRAGDARSSEFKKDRLQEALVDRSQFDTTYAFRAVRNLTLLQNGPVVFPLLSLLPKERDEACILSKVIQIGVFGELWVTRETIRRRLL